MISTKNERMAKGIALVKTLLGPKFINYSPIGNKRPPTLPKGVNYTASEWHKIRQTLQAYRAGRDVSIQYLFDLEEMEVKYRDSLMLGKLES